MTLDDLYTIAVISALVVFSIGIALLAQREKPLLGVGESPAEDPPSPATDMNDVMTAEEEELELTVTFSKSGMQHPWNPIEESLLEFAETLGIDVDSQCRAGECGSCRTKIISGEVEYRQQPSISPGKGHCLLCVSIPKSDLTLAS
jgi:ferredoxin